ncbi:hypothetical protein FOZ63_001830 [Perkinsus olseni]|uniref:Uncharacterized protein n=1 Tax=Perkinsus olseni TaxID=32597 RepID=A0A7J6QBX8_PEROL|nr:hypothetical protein FOZ63_001830 [Perkinsus olseni]KAF4706039.1 hypothetical protein FOZ62_024147 [Perkinsus olseni]
MASSSVIILWAAANMAAATTVADNDATYVYESNKIRVTFETTLGKADLAARCGGSLYHTNQFTLNTGDYPVFHTFPDTSSVTLIYSDIIASFRTTCRGVLKVEDSDLRKIVRTQGGDMTTQLGGKTITLKRQWPPLITGRFVTNSPVSLIKQQFDIHPDGYAYVIFWCDGDGRDTGFMLYRLTLKKNGNGRYELTRARTGRSVQHLLKKLKEVCPSTWSEDNDYMNQLKNIRFANENVMYGIGIHETLSRVPV